jgi:outer membrane lipoprotein-sorting protein
MSLPAKFARALVPIVIAAAPISASAKMSPDLAKVQAHVRAVHSMTANFVQTDSKGRSMSGTLQLKRPGRIRFEYGRGANMLLVGNGSTLTFVDYEVGQKSSWPINKTPLGLLLSANPDVEHVAQIVASKDPRVLVVRAADPYHKEFGTLILAFIRDSSGPGGLKLYGWTAIDGQGKRTKVELTNQHNNAAVPNSAFTYAEPKKRR